MLNLRRVEKRFGSFICRRCLNKHYHAKLEPHDCMYGYYYTCPSCKEDHHIVVGLYNSGKLKMLLK